MKLSFTKMQGCANDYIYLDCRTSGVPEKIVPLAQKLSARHFSVGADGAMVRNIVLFGVLIYELVGPALTSS